MQGQHEKNNADADLDVALTTSEHQAPIAHALPGLKEKDELQLTFAPAVDNNAVELVSQQDAESATASGAASKQADQTSDAHQSFAADQAALSPADDPMTVADSLPAEDVFQHSPKQKGTATSL